MGEIRKIYRNRNEKIILTFFENYPYTNVKIILKAFKQSVLKRYPNPNYVCHKTSDMNVRDIGETELNTTLGKCHAVRTMLANDNSICYLYCKGDRLIELITHGIYP